MRLNLHVKLSFQILRMNKNSYHIDKVFFGIVKGNTKTTLKLIVQVDFSTFENFEFQPN